MDMKLGDAGLDLIFREAHTYNGWLERPVSEATLHELYDLMKWGPTSMNCCPLRLVFLRSSAARERLKPALMAGNVDKTMAAPVTAIIAQDLTFYEKLPLLYPQIPGARERFAGSSELAKVTAMRNSSLQGAYFIIAARSLGLGCGPMSGFDNAKVDEEFFGGANGSIKSNFLCNIGYGDPAKIYPRNPRLAFDEACTIL